MHQIENRIMQLGINGYLERVTMLKSIPDMVNAAVKRGAQTVVAIGNDDTISKIISVLPQHKVTFGIIPVGEPQSIAQHLGIPTGVAACDTISARITTKIDLGKANNTYFIGSLNVPDHAIVSMNVGSYTISPTTTTSTVQIYNIDGAVAHSNPTDGKLEAVIHDIPTRSGLFGMRKTYSRASVFPITKLTITAETTSVPVVADGQLMVKTPVTVEVVPLSLKVIVGKHRMF